MGVELEQQIRGGMKNEILVVALSANTAGVPDVRRVQVNPECVPAAASEFGLRQGREGCRENAVIW